MGRLVVLMLFTYGDIRHIHPSSLSSDTGKKSKKCEAGIYAFGTDETAHPLQELGEDYAHILEVSPIQHLHLSNLAEALRLPPSQKRVEGDLLSGLILAVDRLKDRTGLMGQKCERHLVVVTDACSRMASTDGLEEIVQQVREGGRQGGREGGSERRRVCVCFLLVVNASSNPILSSLPPSLPPSLPSSTLPS